MHVHVRSPSAKAASSTHAEGLLGRRVRGIANQSDFGEAILTDIGSESTLDHLPECYHPLERLVIRRVTDGRQTEVSPEPLGNSEEERAIRPQTLKSKYFPVCLQCLLH